MKNRFVFLGLALFAVGIIAQDTCDLQGQYLTFKLPCAECADLDADYDSWGVRCCNTLNNKTTMIDNTDHECCRGSPPVVGTVICQLSNQCFSTLYNQDLSSLSLYLDNATEPFDTCRLLRAGTTPIYITTPSCSNCNNDTITVTPSSSVSIILSTALCLGSLSCLLLFSH